MWILINVGAVEEKIDGQPNRILLELWHHLKAREAVLAAEVQGTEARVKAPCLAMCLQDFLQESTQTLPGPLPPQEGNCALWFD